jgi:hypothetical protein
MCSSFADLLLYSYETDLMTGFSRKTKRWYTGGVLSLNNLKFGYYVDLIIFYLTINKWHNRYSYLDVNKEIDSEDWLRTKLYNKRDDFEFPMVHFTCMWSNIPTAPADGVYIFQLIR